MSYIKKFVIFTAGFVMLTAPLLAVEADAKTKLHHRHYVSRRLHHPVLVTNKIAGNGWRRRSRGWDNSCLNVPYLTSEFACDAK
jgi:hypothetical protein